MKKILFALLAGSLIACGTNDKTSPATSETKPEVTTSVDAAAVTTIEWLDSTHKQLANLKFGESVEISYRFKNSGNKALVIENVSAQCGCTVPEKPEKPIAPGEEGVIKAIFNSKNGQPGTVRKAVTVTANTTQKTQELTFGVEVTP